MTSLYPPHLVPVLPFFMPRLYHLSYLRMNCLDRHRPQDLSVLDPVSFPQRAVKAPVRLGDWRETYHLIMWVVAVFDHTHLVTNPRWRHQDLFFFLLDNFSLYFFRTHFLNDPTWPSVKPMPILIHDLPMSICDMAAMELQSFFSNNSRDFCFIPSASASLKNVFIIVDYYNALSDHW